MALDAARLKATIESVTDLPTLPSVVSRITKTGLPKMLSPSTRMSPPLTSSRPHIMRMVVVLPHPDGPKSTMNSFLSIRRFKLSTISGPSLV